MSIRPGAVPEHEITRGCSTASPVNVTYRIGKLRAHGIVVGRWLDCGCGDGGYTRALLDFGADAAVGVDIEPETVERARTLTAAAGSPAQFEVARAESLPFPDAAFDGVYLNEVLEHVLDERGALAEINRVLRPGGHLAVMSPNRWFPFDGHGVRFGQREWRRPTPLLPWLPERVSRHLVIARNYWPHALAELVSRAGFRVIAVESVFPVLEMYPWLPRRAIPYYRAAVPRIERTPGLRRFGVSTLVVARRDGEPG
jgi:SAM-dependent methyltransferase